MQPRTEIIQPWERQPGESEEAFEAFTVYAELGTERAIRKVSEKLGKNDSLLEKWSSRNRWRARCEAWDRHKARQSNELIILERADMRKRLIVQAKNIQAQVASRILNMTADEIKKLKPMECAALFRSAAAVEMQARIIPGSELEAGAQEFTPTFNVNFVPSKPPELVHVRTADGMDGFLPPEAVDKFIAENEGSTVIFAGTATERALAPSAAAVQANQQEVRVQ